MAATIMNEKKLQYVSISVIFSMLVGTVATPYGSTAFAPNTQPKDPSSNQTSNVLANIGTNTNITSLLKPGNSTYTWLLVSLMQ